jgi:hypothetical protein
MTHETHRLARLKGMACAMATVATMSACSLRSPGDPGTPVLSFSILAEDAAILPAEADLSAAWRTPDGPFFPASNGAAFSRDRLDVFEEPPADAFVDDAVARLDFLMATFDDLTRIAEGRAPREAVARSRAQLWWIQDREAAVDVVPDRVAAAFDRLDDDVEILGADAPAPAILVIDSGDPEARRCGDNVVADQLPACAGCAFDDRPQPDEPSCCVDLRAAFDACAAIVVDRLGDVQEQPVRLRVLTP